MKPEVSIVISSHDRLALLRRTLYSIATRGPSVPYEVLLVDDGSDEDVLGELKKFSSAFLWKFIKVDNAVFEEKTGIKHFFNNSALTTNAGVRLAGGEFIYLMGNEVIAWGDVFDKLREDAPQGASHWMAMSTTYDVPRQLLDLLDPFGQNLLPAYVKECEQWPLQSRYYTSDVTNYLMLSPRATWLALGGIDERYMGGISAEDSDLVRRARTLPGFQRIISDGVSLHQSHGGKTKYYDPLPSVVSRERFQEGCAINRAVYDSWSGQTYNPQRWPWGEYGVGEVVTNAPDEDAIRRDYIEPYKELFS